MQRLRLLPLAVALLAVVTVTVLVSVLTVDIDDLGRPEAPAGYVACPRPDPTYGLNKGDGDCPTPGRFTPKEDIVYCEATSRAAVDMEECLYGG